MSEIPAVVLTNQTVLTAVTSRIPFLLLLQERKGILVCSEMQEGISPKRNLQKMFLNLAWGHPEMVPFSILLTLQCLLFSSSPFT